MELISKKRIESLIPTLKVLCILMAYGATCLLLFKELYFYEWSEKKEAIIYSIPMVFLFFYWIKFKLDEEHIFDLRVIGLDALAASLAAVRVIGLLFHSGHVLFLLYTLLTTKSKAYKLMCIPMVLITAYFKLFYWNDFVTPIIGIGLALILVHCRKKIIQKINTETS